MLAGAAIAAEGDDLEPDVAEGNAVPEPAIRVEEIVIRAPRVRIVSPLPGVGIDREQAATNIQSATGKEIAESRAINITEFMNNNMQSVSINDYAGNPFQQDLNFRGFTASPMIGTPQGISVYLDGVRVNEAFGDVVNWDLLPMNAIASMDLLPGSSPLFGLNTLGGALAIRTKTGFTDNFARGEVIGGAWGRQQMQLSNGINNGVLGLFTAYNHFEEDGWRRNSPSNLRQLYNNATLKLPKGEINLSALNVDTALTGNGLVPFEMAEVNRKWVFTSPDESSNKLDHYNLNGRWDVSDNFVISALAYKRKMNQSAMNGDFYDEYQQLVGRLNIDYINGRFNLSDLNQDSVGITLQAAWDAGNHQIVFGGSFDKNKVKFRQQEMYGEIDGDRQVNPVRDEGYYWDGLYAAKYPVLRNDLKGHSTTKSLFFSDTWSPKDNLHITYGTRFNWSHVVNELMSDFGNDLYQFEINPANPINGNSGRLLDPRRQRCPLPGDPFETFARFVCTDGDYKYKSFNPSIGIVWEAIESLSLYGNISRGARIPTIVELGCARDHTRDNEPGSTNFQYGCSIPTSLSADPYLKQVRSTSYEAGVRGRHDGIIWNVGFFRTELKNDILFMPLGRKNRGVFDNFGETLRQGVEMGFKAEIGRSRLGINYTYLLATFESPANAINPNNSSNTAPQTLQSYVNIEPGDSLSGMPRHIVQANWNYQFNDRFDATLNMIMHSFSYVRGNENNEHRPRSATDAQYCTLSGCSNADPYDYIGKGAIPGYAIFNLRATYKFDYGMTLFVKADNIFNKEYSTAGDLGRSPFGSGGVFNSDTTQWQNTTFIGPGAPRAIWIGLAFDLNWKKFAADSNTQK
ncbi:TonB-dependent receptor [Methylobacillus arboreus]|uniref:TonB-dependent receptor n=1 Tax=Methylobacillus arboreus TaxID=755170 RepID=UPI001E29F5CC|nr:TonB-dependent receptor [Methylobacillus arboreus]MCB5189205.1 TonB-dependent receptor [Methylobacillus arboreus]